MCVKRLLLSFMFFGCTKIQMATVDPDASVLDHMPRPSQLAGDLQAAGLDIHQLPALGELDQKTLHAVMKTFTVSLGITCKDCHAKNFAADTPQKRVTQQMWELFVRGLALHDGTPLYCDSCHQGNQTFLDRTGKLEDWMDTAYVDGLARRDGQAHSCVTCHGSPFNGQLLDTWGADGADAGTAQTDGNLDGGTGGNVHDSGTADADKPDAGKADAGAGDSDAGAPDAGNSATSCGALVTCLEACTTQNCATKCYGAASQSSQDRLSAAIDCSNQTCEAAGRCFDDSDNSSDCMICFNNALAGGASGAVCSPSDDANCGDCATQWVACVSD
jgi:hypothetical protein